MRITPSRHPPTAASAGTHQRRGCPGSALTSRHVTFIPCLANRRPVSQPVIQTPAASSVSGTSEAQPAMEARTELQTKFSSCRSLAELSSLAKAILQLDHDTISATLHSTAVLRRRQLCEEAKGKKKKPCSLKEGPNKTADDLKSLLDLLLPASLLTLKVSSSISWSILPYIALRRSKLQPTFTGPGVVWTVHPALGPGSAWPPSGGGLAGGCPGAGEQALGLLSAQGERRAAGYRPVGPLQAGHQATQAMAKKVQNGTG